MKRMSNAASLTSRQFGLVCASVLAAVFAHAAHIPWPILGLTLALLCGRWLQRERNAVRISIWIKLPLMLLFPAMVYAHYGNVFGREPGSALACAMLALKLVETETRRDARTTISFTSFVLMSALLFDTALGFTLLLFGALILLLATLRELEPRAATRKTMPLRQEVQGHLASAAFALLAAVPLAICAFVFFPRLDSPLWRTPGDASARTGMSDSMSPGSIQDLLIDDSPAFRASFDGQLPKRNQLYWRGPVLIDFDGTTWTRHLAGLAHAKDVQASGETVGYEVTLEANDKVWLFALDVPVEVPSDSLRSSDMSIIRSRAVTDLVRYRVRSALGYRLDTTLSTSQRNATLNLPPGFDARSVQLAQSWRRDLNNDEKIIGKALDLFHQTFFYTLSPPPLGRDSIDDFLFDTRRGFCEHYASAFVFLMRAAGIPARVVTGYQGGYFNEVGNYLLVRQSDAHAWAEVWLDGKGWVRIDPTAAVSPQRVELGAQAVAGTSSAWYPADWILTMRNQFDLINRGWNSVVVQFNALRQQSLLTPFGVDKADFATLTWVLIVTSSLLLGLTALWVMRTPRRRVEPADAAYDALCNKLARAGIVRGPSEGPMDFSRRLQETQLLAGPSVRQAQALLAQYVGLRYASVSAEPARIAVFARAVRELRAMRGKATASPA